MPLRSFRFRFVSLVAFSLLSLAAALAEDKYVKNKDAVFPDVEPGHALVYFARPDFMRLIPSPTLKLFLDSTPTGWLPQRSYMAAQVEPGSHVVWGPGGAPHRVDLEAGKTYFLILVVQYGPNNAVNVEGWEDGEPGDVRAFVARRKLAYVKPNEDSLAKLREEGAKKGAKAEERAPEIHPAALPATFENVWYRATRKITWKGYAATGTLMVSGDGMEFKSDKEILTISWKDVRYLGLDRFTGLVGSSDESRWNMINFNQNGTEAFAAFRDRREQANTDQIFLTLQAALQSAMGGAPRGTPAQPEAVSAVQPAADHEPNASPTESAEAKPDVKTGQIEENQPYKSRGGMFSATVPRARNPFVRTYQLYESRLKQGSADYEEAAFVIQDFGQTYGAGVHRIPASVLEAMAKQEPKQVLSDLADKTVFSWRKFAEEPKSVEEAPVQTQFGDGLLRIYVAPNSSLLTRVTGADASGQRVGKNSDARIAVVVVKKGDSFVYAAAEDESVFPGAAPLDLHKQLQDFFASMTVNLQESSAPSKPAPASAGLPEGYVLYDGSKDQFTIGIPNDWKAYDQGELMKAQGMKGGNFDMIRFLPAKDFESALFGNDAIKADTGEIPTFFVQKLGSEKGMSCAALTENGQKKMIEIIGKDRDFKGKNALEPVHGDPADVGGCKGVHVRGKAQAQTGSPVVVDAYLVSDGKTIYVFSVRNRAEFFAKNDEVFLKAMSTLKISAAK